MEKTNRRTASATMADPLAKATVDTIAKVIAPDGTITDVEPVNGSDFKIGELYTHTKSTIVQMIDMPDGRLMWMDEEGKLNGKEPNPVATKLVEKWLLPGDYIAGHALVCTKRMVR
jgi:hypothetical protein